MGEETIQFSYRMPADLYHQIKQLAQDDDRSMTNFMNLMLRSATTNLKTKLVQRQVEV